MFRSKLTILFSLLFSCLITIGIAGVSEIYAQGDDIILVSDSGNGQSFEFPGYIEELSPLIKNVLTNTSNESASREIPVPVSGSTLKRLQMLIPILRQAAQDITGKKVDLKNSTLKQLQNQIIFSNPILQKKISKKVIQRLSDDELNQLIKVSGLLEIEPLTNALAHFVAKRILDGSSCIHWEIPEVYITKHQGLILSNLTEYTVADCFAKHGQESFITEGAEGLILDLSNKKLTGLQGLDKLDDREQIHQIILDHNQIQDYDLYSHKDVFKPFTQLQFLSMRNNQLLGLPKDLFRHLFELRELHLSDNQLSRLPRGIFDDLEQLQLLNLDDNMLGILGRRTFMSLEKLQFLSLKNNRLEKLPNGIFGNLNNLQELSLENNRLKKLPNEIFGNLNNLQKLSLKNNRLKELPNGIFHNLNNLQTLSLSNNKLEKIESKRLFRPLISLERIELDHNRFTELPKDMFKKSTDLQYVNVRHNHISTIKDNFFGHTVKATIKDHIGVPKDAAFSFYPQAGRKNHYLNRCILGGKVTVIVGGGILCSPLGLPTALCVYHADDGDLDPYISELNPVNKCYGPSICTWACQSPMCYKE